MSEVDVLPRAMCLRETDDNFFVAVNRPYKNYMSQYAKLLQLSPHGSVYRLEEGSQVFVYPRDEFDPDVGLGDRQRLSDTSLFGGRVIMAAQGLGNVAIDPTVERVEDKIAPGPFV